MAKYDLQPIQSMYRDTGSVQVNELKRKEYMANMQADNALATSVMNMEALEEDSETLYSLADKYNAGIDERAQRTDYENLGMTIHRDAMSFIKDYTPIKKSKDLYTAYENMLKEKVNKGLITTSIKDRKLAQSKSKYKGIQYTPSGTVDRDSYFKGENVAHYVDVNAEFAKAMKDVVAREGEYEGYELRDGDFEIVLDRYPLDGVEKSKAGNPVWLVKKGKKILGEVDSNLVANVTNAVLKRDDVHAYLRQEADLSTYMLTDEEAQEKINNSLASIDSKIDETIADKDLSDEKRAETVQYYEDYKERILKNVETNGARNTLVGVTHDDLKKEYLKDAQNKYVYRNEAYSETPSVLDEDGVGSGGSNKDKPQVFFNTGVSGAMTSVVIGGTTTPQIQKHLAEQVSIIDKTTTEYADRNVSAELLYNADTDAEIEEILALMPEDNKVGKETLIGDIKNLRRARDKQTLANIRLNEAKNSVYKDGETEQAYKERKSKDLVEPERLPGTTLPYKEQNQYLSREDILAGLIKAGALEEGATLYDALAYLEGQEAFTGESDVAVSYAPTGGTGTTIKRRGYGEFVNALYGDEGEVDPNILKARNKFLGNVVQEFRRTMQSDRDIIETTLKNDTIKFDGLVDTSYGDTTDETKTAINNAIKEGLNDNIAVITMAGEEKIGYKQYIRETYGEGDVVEINVAQTGLVNVANPSGVPMIAVSIKSKVKKNDKDIGDTEYIFIPASEINAYTDGDSTIDNHVNSTGFKVNRLYAEGLAHNVTSWSPEIFTVGPKGEESSKVEFKYQNDNGSENSKPIIITSMNSEGVITTTAHAKAEGLKILEGLLDQPINNEGDTYAKYLY